MHCLGQSTSALSASFWILKNILVHGSAIGDGNRHNHDDLPVIVAGRGNGTIDPGRHLVAPKNTPMSNLLLSTLHAIGSDAPRHGDSSGPLGGLTV